MNKEREANFQSEFTASVRKQFPKAHYYKIPDPRADEFRQRQASTVKRPYDNYLFHQGQFYAFELKFVKKCVSFNFKSLEEHQFKYLQEVSENGGRAFVVINYKFKPTKKQAKEHNLLIKEYDFTLAIDINSYINFQTTFGKMGHKSIPINILLYYYKEFKNVKKEDEGKKKQGIITVCGIKDYKTQVHLHFIKKDITCKGIWRLDKFLVNDWIYFGRYQHAEKVKSDFPKIKELIELSSE